MTFITGPDGDWELRERTSPAFGVYRLRLASRPIKGTAFCHAQCDKRCFIPGLLSRLVNSGLTVNPNAQIAPEAMQDYAADVLMRL